MSFYSRRSGPGAPFTLLADGKPRWGSFGAGFGVEFLFIVIIVGAPMVMPQKLDTARHYWFTPIYSPPVVAWKPQPQPVKPVVEKKPVPIPKPKPMVAMKPKPEIIAPPPKPKIVAPVFTAPVARPATGHRNTSRPDVPEIAHSFPDARPNSSFGSSAIPTLKKPRDQVQTGGFGDPNGVPATGNPNKAANIAKLGSYDLPPGPGYGNGTGGARGAKGIVASAGFGNGVANGGRGGSGGGAQGTVKQGVFADERPTNEAPKPRNTASSKPATEPVEILFKPKPVYTDLARQKRIEGEVLLEVVFSTTGDVRILRVMQGLGYGLEEAAVAAARQIRFHPARQDGRPVDSTATVHILFELAY